MSVNDQINELLAQWDPIEIAAAGGPVYYEYSSYVPRIRAVLSVKALIKSLLEHIVTEEMGLAYDKHNPDHVKEIEELSEKLSKLQNRK